MYAIHKFNLTQSQINHLEKALVNNKPTTLTITVKNLNGSHPLPVTEAEMKHISNCLGDRTSVAVIKISLSKKKLQFIKDNASGHEGGFLPLLSLIPLIAGGIGAAGGVASGIASAVQAANTNKNEKAKLVEQERHNREVESNLKSGEGLDTIGVTDCPNCGCTLKVKAKEGKGLYLKPYSGSGLVRLINNAVNPSNQLPDIPSNIKNIPVLNKIASALY